MGDAVFEASPERAVDVSDEPGKRLDGVDDLRVYVAQYDANLRWADRHLGEVADRLKRLGLWEQAAVLIFSDHGEQMGEHFEAYFEHGPWPHEPAVRVPLVAIGPGVEAGRRVARPVELVDLLPTLRDWMLPVADVAVDGDSFASWLGGPPPAAPRAALAFAEAGKAKGRTLQTVRDERWKLIHWLPYGDKQERVQLFDLAADPLERRDLARIETVEASRLRRHLARAMRAEGATAEAGRPRSEDELTALRALGYLDSD